MVNQSMKDVPEILKELKPELADKFGVKRIGVFGSYARGSISPESDIDILVEFSRPIGWDFLDLKDFLENRFRKPVDLVTTKALKQQLRNSILKEAIFA